jgi:hypothetical protein
MQWWLLKINSRFLQLQISLPDFTINSVILFAVFYCRAFIIIVTGTYFTGFT